MSSAKEAAVRLLARREHSAYELVDKLIRKGFSQASALEALEACQADGYQSDERYARALCQTRANQGYGPQRIEYELKQFKLSSELIEQILEDSLIDWNQEARRVLRKKFKQNMGQDFKAKQKQKQFLSYRGFSSSIIQEVMSTESYDEEF